MNIQEISLTTIENNLTTLSKAAAEKTKKISELKIDIDGINKDIQNLRNSIFVTEEKEKFVELKDHLTLANTTLQNKLGVIDRIMNWLNQTFGWFRSYRTTLMVEKIDDTIAEFDQVLKTAKDVIKTYPKAVGLYQEPKIIKAELLALHDLGKDGYILIPASKKVANTFNLFYFEDESVKEKSVALKDVAKSIPKNLKPLDVRKKELEEEKVILAENRHHLLEFFGLKEEEVKAFDNPGSTLQQELNKTPISKKFPVSFLYKDQSNSLHIKKYTPVADKPEGAFQDLRCEFDPHLSNVALLDVTNERVATLDLKNIEAAAPQFLGMTLKQIRANEKALNLQEQLVKSWANYICSMEDLDLHEPNLPVMCEQISSLCQRYKDAAPMSVVVLVPHYQPNFVCFTYDKGKLQVQTVELEGNQLILKTPGLDGKVDSLPLQSADDLSPKGINSLKTLYFDPLKAFQKDTKKLMSAMVSVVNDFNRPFQDAMIEGAKNGTYAIPFFEYQPNSYLRTIAPALMAQEETISHLEKIRTQFGPTAKKFQETLPEEVQDTLKFLDFQIAIATKRKEISELFGKLQTELTKSESLVQLVQQGETIMDQLNVHLKELVKLCGFPEEDQLLETDYFYSAFRNFYSLVLLDKSESFLKKETIENCLDGLHDRIQKNKDSTDELLKIIKEIDIQIAVLPKVEQFLQERMNEKADFRMQDLHLRATTFVTSLQERKTTADNLLKKVIVNVTVQAAAPNPIQGLSVSTQLSENNTRVAKAVSRLFSTQTVGLFSSVLVGVALNNPALLSSWGALSLARVAFPYVASYVAAPLVGAGIGDVADYLSSKLKISDRWAHSIGDVAETISTVASGYAVAAYLPALLKVISQREKPVEQKPAETAKEKPQPILVQQQPSQLNITPVRQPAPIQQPVQLAPQVPEQQEPANVTIPVQQPIVSNETQPFPTPLQVPEQQVPSSPTAAIPQAIVSTTTVQPSPKISVPQVPANITVPVQPVSVTDHTVQIVTSTLGTQALGVVKNVGEIVAQTVQNRANLAFSLTPVGIVYNIFKKGPGQTLSDLLQNVVYTSALPQQHAPAVPSSVQVSTQPVVQQVFEKPIQIN